MKINDENYRVAILTQLELIAGIQQDTERMRQNGEKEDGLMIRQYKYLLKKDYLPELNRFLEQMGFKVELVDLSSN